MQIRSSSGGIHYIMAENTIKNGGLHPNNSNILTESGDISQHNKKHILCYLLIYKLPSAFNLGVIAVPIPF